MKTKSETDEAMGVDVSDGGPGLGEVRLGEDRGGYRYAARRQDDGSLHTARVRCSSGEGAAAGDYPVINECLHGFQVDTRARRGQGPSKVNSVAYKAGWENTYGRHGGKAS